MTGVRQRRSAISVGVGALLLAFLVVPAAAEDPPGVVSEQPAAAPTLLVESDPAGAVVTLRGPYEWTGMTPWRLYRQVNGLYHVEVRLPGYEVWSDDVVLGEGGLSNLRVELGKRTMAKALVRSAVIPGWGQIYRGSKVKGGFFIGGTVLALGGVIWTNEAYRNNVDDFNVAKRAYEGVSRQDDLAAAYDAVRRASERAQRNYDRRKLALGVLGGVYALNLLDVVFFAPSGSAVSGPADRTETPAGGGSGGLEWLADASPAGGVRAGLCLRWK